MTLWEAVLSLPLERCDIPDVGQLCPGWDRSRCGQSETCSWLAHWWPWPEETPTLRWRCPATLAQALQVGLWMTGLNTLKRHPEPPPPANTERPARSRSLHRVRPVGETAPTATDQDQEADWWLRGVVWEWAGITATHERWMIGELESGIGVVFHAPGPDASHYRLWHQPSLWHAYRALPAPIVWTWQAGATQ